MSAPGTASEALEFVTVDLAYTKVEDQRPIIRVFPPSSGRRTTSPERERIKMPIYDCRPLMEELFHQRAAVVDGHLDPLALRGRRTTPAGWREDTNDGALVLDLGVGEIHCDEFKRFAGGTGSRHALFLP